MSEMFESSRDYLYHYKYFKSQAADESRSPEVREYAARQLPNLWKGYLTWRACERRWHAHDRAGKLYKLAWSAGAWASDAFNEADQQAWEYWSVRKDRLLRLARKAATRAGGLGKYDWIRWEAERLCLPL